MLAPEGVVLELCLAVGTVLLEVWWESGSLLLASVTSLLSVSSHGGSRTAVRVEEEGPVWNSSALAETVSTFTEL